MVVIDSPAKLNLALRVIRKRKDGYHELVTLFHRISLRDTLRIEKAKDGRICIECSHPKVPRRKNLIARAFDLLKKNSSSIRGVRVRLIKRIPVGGGLGGGSSNAASFLLGMNRLFKLRLSTQTLMKIGGELGSDIPFFISGVRHGIGRGRGERIQRLEFKRRLWFVLVPSERGLSTQAVYKNLPCPRTQPSLTEVIRSVKIASASLEKGDLGRADPFFHNDLSESAERIRPSLKKRKEDLSALHLGTCRMSGSGPTLFIIFSSKEKARQAVRRLQNSGFESAILSHSY